MCGIIIYVGDKQAGTILIQGLKRLEYRGYDSSGIAVICNGVIKIVKSVGSVQVLDEKTNGGKDILGNIGIGHTRWATHGMPSDINSHPHLSDDGKFAIVHNGIIENYAELKSELISKGYTFASETDSEVIAQLLQYYYNGDILDTIKKVTSSIKGSYAIGIISLYDPNSVYVLRKDNPLVIGLGKGENFISSDYAAAIEYTHSFIHLGEQEIAKITSNTITIFNSEGKEIEKNPYTIDWDIDKAEKGGYQHYMLKEIYEQPLALRETISPRIDGDDIHLDKIKFTKDQINSINKIDIIGCGSAYYAGIVGKWFIEKHCRIPVNCILASEYIYSEPITGKNTLTIIISQSGETADSLSALRLAKKSLSHTISVVNVVESAIARESDDVLYTHAGPEIAVATTKGYTSQVVSLYLIGLSIAKIKNTISTERYKELLKGLDTIPEKVESLLSNIDSIKAYAKKYAKQKCIFFIGRGNDYAASLEGALKLKEISYIHAEAYAAGELKHGTISLIEEDTVAIAIVTQKYLYPKMLSNINSVISRKGIVISVSSYDNRAIGEHTNGNLIIPACDDDLSPVLTAIVLQLFAYYVALERGCNIDKPRNLAKSVTVE